MMFGFLRRHKKKSIAAGCVISGAWLIIYYAKKRQEHREKMMMTMLIKTRRQHHYESNSETCNFTTQSMVPTLHDVLMQKVNVESIKEQLSSSSCDKLSTWEQLKILCFTQTIGAVYGLCVLTTFIHVQLNVVGGYIFSEKFGDGSEIASEQAGTMSTSLQHKYLAAVQFFFSRGMNQLIKDVQRAVESVLTPCQLNEALDQQRLRGLLQAIHINLQLECSNHLSALLLPPPVLPRTADLSQEEQRFNIVKQETTDLVNSADFQSTVLSCLATGFEWLCKETAKMTSSMSMSSSMSTEGDASFTRPPVTSLPLAKVIPLIDSLLSSVCDERSSLLQALLSDPELSKLSMNIYESYSFSACASLNGNQPVSTSTDQQQQQLYRKLIDAAKSNFVL